MAMLGEKFPKTQFVVTGVLGPHSNAHGPNEFLHLATVKKNFACIASHSGGSWVEKNMSFLDGPDDDPKRAARRPLLAFVLLKHCWWARGHPVFSEPSIPTWYANLVHPAIAPPNWVFAPVWTTLYILMAVAAWRVCASAVPGRKRWRLMACNWR